MEKYKYACYGIRRQDHPFDEVGDTMTHTSLVWVDGEETEDELDGVCALNIKRYPSLEEAIEVSRQYDGEYVGIIASDYYTYGEDADEVVLRDPVVIWKSEAI